MRLKILVRVCLVWGLLSAVTLSAWADRQDQEYLRSGVNEIAAPGLPGTVAAYAPEAFAVVVGKVGKNLTEPLVAAGPYGKGHAVIFGHTAYLDEALETADTGKLVVNAVRWVTPKKPTGPKQIWVRGLPRLLAYLQKKGLDARPLEGDAWLAQLAEVGVVCMDTGSLNDTEVKALQAYLAKGGGLVSSDTGWGWQQIHGGKSLAEHPGNRLLAPAGLAWAEGTLQRTSRTGFDTERAPSELCQAQNALKVVVAQAEGGAQAPAAEIAQAVWTLSAAAHILPTEDMLLRTPLKALRQKHQAELAQLGQKPISAKDSLARLLLTLELDDAKNLPADQVQANPAAQNFPGGIPADARRATRTVEIDTSVPEWHSTGLYAAPGEKITVEIPQELIGKGFQVRIGAHTDTLWHLEHWDRAPEISRAFPLKSHTTLIANAFGGAIYIVVPNNRKLGTVSVTLHNAVVAPYFVRGKTDLTAWRTAIRSAPAPWAELEAHGVILTVPSSAVRNLDDPEALLAYWDEALDACADLYAIPRKRLRPERYCVDRQISAGYMHSGYPIMTGSDVANTFTDVTILRGKQGIRSWGFYHEVGHNHQRGEWTFDGTGEVTNNLNSLYCCEKLNGVSPEDYGPAHPALTPKAMKDRFEKYLAGGANFAQWKEDPFLALTMYIQLRRAFGWEAFQQVFAAYNTLPAGQRPRSEIDKHDLWMTKFSLVTGKNLGPFFQAWGVPTSEQARQTILKLPVWMPPDFSTK